MAEYITEDTIVEEIVTDSTTTETVDDGTIKVIASGTYEGADTDSISVTVDNTELTISAEIAQVQYSSYLEFPNVGSSKLLYMDTTENAVYRWDSDNLAYICVGRDYSEIETINGGNAS